MIYIKIDFLSGRWHATAWGTHVNEGIPEWPPCPWRLCRALIATWHLKHHGDQPEVLQALIGKLSDELPDYLLPTASVAHTRHYMPVVEGKKEKSVKVFDTFVHVSAGDNYSHSEPDARQSLWVRWAVDLSEEEHSMLCLLLEGLNYMGRAESLIQAALTEAPVEVSDSQKWTCPESKNAITNGEIVRLLAPQAQASYNEWLQSQQLPASNVAGKSKAKSKTAKSSKELPDSTFKAMLLDTADWKKDGWNIPPGSRWVNYMRPENSFKISPVSPVRPKIFSHQPDVARYAIVSKVPPGITQALSLAERFHQALCSKLKNSTSILTGLDSEGNPLQDNNHVYYLPECDSKGYVTHMTLHAPGGFDEAACRVLGKLHRVWGIEGFDIDIILLATGTKEDFTIASPYFEKSRTWRSITPFIPVRHPKATRTGVLKTDSTKGDLQIGSAEHDCWRLIQVVAKSLKLELPVTAVTLYERGNRIKHGLREIPCLDYQLRRRTGTGNRAGSSGYALHLEFAEPVSLPLGFGYGGHFALGLFLPDEAGI